MSGHVFDEVYAGAYDALYQDKDYEAECDFLEQIFACYAQVPICAHPRPGLWHWWPRPAFGRRGYTVTGVGRFETMLAEARRKTNALIQGYATLCRATFATSTWGCTFKELK